MAQHVEISHFEGAFYRKLEQSIINKEPYIAGSLLWQNIGKPYGKWFQKVRPIRILQRDCQCDVSIQVEMENGRIKETHGVKHIFIVA